MTHIENESIPAGGSALRPGTVAESSGASEPSGTEVVRSFGEVLRRIPPEALADMTEQVQGVVAAALHWFTVTAPTVSAAHCVGLVRPPVPDVHLSLPEVTVERALRPASFRTHVRELRHAVDVCERPASQAFSALPVEDRTRVHRESGVSGKQELLGPLLDDIVYARAWLAAYGTKAGYWSYYFTGLSLRVAAIDSALSQRVLADALVADADYAFHAHFGNQELAGAALAARGRGCLMPYEFDR